MNIRLPTNKTALLTIFIVFSFGLSACGSKPYIPQSQVNPSKIKVLNTAKDMLGVKYRYGGSHPSRGFDCSGLVQYTHKAAGIHLPRTTSAQYRASRPIQKRYLKPGDLVFFKTAVSRAISHVGIYLGNNKFIHAPSSGKQVKINSMTEKYWRNRFTAAGRVL